MPVFLARCLTLVLLMLAWIVPYAIVEHTYPLPTFYAEFVTLALYLGLAVSVGWLAFEQRRRVAASSPRVAITPLLFACVLLLQTIALPTAQPSMNMLGAGCLLAAYLTTHAGYWLGRLEATERVLAWGAAALLLGGLFAVFCQLVQVFHAEARFSPFVVAYNVATQRRPFGNMAQANHLATYISFAMAAALFLVQTRRLPYLLWLVLSAVFACGEALTVSRGPWLQTGVVIVGAAVVAWAQGRRQRGARGWEKYRLWLTPVLLLVIFLAVNAWVRWANLAYHWQLAESAAERFQDPGQISPRLALWKYGWTMFKSHPLLGVGWGEFPCFQYALVETLGKVEVANNSHNVVIDLLAKTGIIGFGVVAFGLGAWLWRVLAAPHSVAKVFGLVMLGVLGMHAMVEYPQQYLFFLLPAAFVIGLLETQPTRNVMPRLAHVSYGVLAVAGLAALYPVYRDYQRSEVLYYGTSPEAQYRAAPAHIFGAWGEYGLATLLTLDTQDLAVKLAMHRQAIALLPGETVVRRYAILLALAGREKEALDAVQRLQIFAEMLHDWPAQRAAVFKLCDQQGAALADFRAKLQARYGAQPKSVNEDDVGDSDDD